MDHFTKDDGPQLNLPIRFRTRSIDGRLITLSAQGLEGTIFTVCSNNLFIFSFLHHLYCYQNDNYRILTVSLHFAM
ncbi:unnamed protein product [Brugia timori]|uniref:Uncharacterized protein n=1 Tax=Brugia timori TaxID=42155 RepID=A0A0R3R9D9_9BILA|nr:unnamed protein product [Brugia timori]